jgi:glycerol kinase
MRYIMAIDQGTTGTKVVLFDAKEQVHSFAGSDITQYGSKPGLEHSPNECSRLLRKERQWTELKC